MNIVDYDRMRNKNIVVYDKTHKSVSIVLKWR